jgi:CheY-like chemotaxis protein
MVIVIGLLAAVVIVGLACLLYVLNGARDRRERAATQVPAKPPTERPEGLSWNSIKYLFKGGFMQVCAHSLSSALAPDFSQPSQTHHDRFENSGPQADHSSVQPPSKHPTLLLLSNDASFCTLVRSYLCQLGFLVFVSTSVTRAEGLFLRSGDVNIWLLDVQSLGIDVLCFALKVRELYPAAPIIVFSANGREDNSLLSALWQDWTWIQKPLNLPNLLSIVDGIAGPAKTTPLDQDTYRKDLA